MLLLLLAALAAIDVSTIKIGPPTTVTELDLGKVSVWRTTLAGQTVSEFVDRARLAWMQKSGRKKYTLVWSTVTT